jgi:DNA-binding transcriptional MerR regulator
MTIAHEDGPALASSQPASAVRRYFSIGQLAKEFGLTHRALRFYEDRGLLTPKREGNARLYTPRDRERLAVIVKAKALGFTLAEIKETLKAEVPLGGPSRLSLSAPQIADQIAHLEQQKAEIEAALTELRLLRSKLLGAQAA